MLRSSRFAVADDKESREQRIERRKIANRQRTRDRVLQNMHDEGKTLRNLFDEIDIDASGKVDFEELCRHLDKLGLKILYEDGVDVMRNIDTDGNRMVDFGEFSAWLTSDHSGSAMKRLQQENQRRLEAELRPISDMQNISKPAAGSVSRRPTQREKQFYSNGLQATEGRRTSYSLGMANRTRNEETATKLRRDQNRNLFRQKVIERLGGNSGDDTRLMKLYKKMSGSNGCTYLKFKRFMDRNGIAVMHQDGKELMNEIDINEDGLISFEELKHFLTADHEKIKAEAERRREFESDNAVSHSSWMQEASNKRMTEASKQMGFRSSPVQAGFKSRAKDEKRALFEPKIKRKKYQPRLVRSSTDKFAQSFADSLKDVERPQSVLSLSSRFAVADDRESREQRIERRKIANRQRTRDRVLQNMHDEGKTLRNLFDEIDIDASGKVDFEELCRHLDKLGLKILYEDGVDVMRNIDTDGNRMVDFGEFSAWLTSDHSGSAMKRLQQENQRRLEAELRPISDMQNISKPAAGSVSRRPTQREKQFYSNGLQATEGRRTSYSLGMANRTRNEETATKLRRDQNRNLFRQKVIERLGGNSGDDTRLMKLYKKMSGSNGCTYLKFKRFMDRNGIAVMHQDGKELMNEIDINEDGLISFEELKHFLTADHEKIKAEAERRREFESDNAVSHSSWMQEASNKRMTEASKQMGFRSSPVQAGFKSRAKDEKRALFEPKIKRKKYQPRLVRSSQSVLSLSPSWVLDDPFPFDGWWDIRKSSSHVTLHIIHPFQNFRFHTPQQERDFERKNQGKHNTSTAKFVPLPI